MNVYLTLNIRFRIRVKFNQMRFVTGNVTKNWFVYIGIFAILYTFCSNDFTFFDINI